MLSWLAISVGENLGMKNRIEQYQEIKKPRFNEALDKRLAQDLARADDDGFAPAKQFRGVGKNNFEVQAINQDSDCWSNLWQSIKVQGSRFFSR